MNHQIAKILSLICLCFFAGALPVLFSTAARAQIADAVSVAALKNDIRYAEWRHKNLGQTQKEPAQNEAIDWEKAQEDFVRIQIESEELRVAVGANSISEYKRLKELVGQINKRAVRLKRNLSLPAPDEKSEDIKLTAESFEIAVKTLDESVISFTGNPVFGHSLVIDVEGGKQAACDLQTIIALSNNLRKRFGDAERISGRLARREN